MKKIRTLTLPIAGIDPAPYNPRVDLKPDDPAYRALARSMDEYGLVQPLVVNERTGTLIGGHQRLKVLVARGETSVQAVVVDLPLDKERALNLALNKISGAWDQDKLALVLAELVEIPGFDLGLTGFELPEIEQVFARQLDDPFEEDGVPALPDTAVTQPGDLIELGQHGEHRVLCADMTQPEELRRLMGSELARLCHTDPPYGVAYDATRRPSSKRGMRGGGAKHDAIRNDELPRKQYAEWFGKVAAGLAAAVAPGAPVYVWNSHKYFGLMHDLLREHGFKVSAVLTWAKPSFAPGFGDYNEQTEFCLYGWKSGARHPWYGSNSETTLWQVARDRTHAYRHPTQKALELAERAVRNSSRAGEVVFDPFLGSGTTLVAAARLGRRCFGLEIEPRYCDVIVRRYIALAGKSAVPAAIAERYGAQEAAR